jgi:hypothetical protein
MFYQKPNGDLISLRKPALQRLIKQTIQYRNGIVNPIAVPVYIKFMVPDSGLPRKPQSTTVPSIIEGVANASEETAPSELLTPPGGSRSIEGTNNPGRLQFQGATPLLDEDRPRTPRKHHSGVSILICMVGHLPPTINQMMTVSLL